MLDSLLLLFSVASQLNGLRPALPYTRLSFLALRTTTSRVRTPNTSSLGRVRAALDPPKAGVGSIRWSVSLLVVQWAWKLTYRFFSPIFKRTNDFHPSNPFGRFVDYIVSKFKRPRGLHRRSHTSILIPTNHGVTYAVSHSRRDTPLWRVGRPAEEGGDKDDNGGSGQNVTQGFVNIMVCSLPFIIRCCIC